MSQEINFYQVDETITKALAPLLIKVLEEKKHAIVFCENATQVKEIDASLWTYGRNKFIPHAMFDDGDFDLQPVLITTQEKNDNNASYLALLGDVSLDFAKNFSRIFYFFEEGALAKAKNLAKKFKPTNSYKKQDGKWVKFTL